MNKYTIITNLCEIETGDTLLVSGKSWLARQIQKFQSRQDKEGSKWNHAGMFYWCYDRLMVIEADKRGIACTDFITYYLNRKSDYLCLKPTFKIDGSEYGKFILPFCGHTKYDYLNLLVAQPIKFLTGGKVWIGRKEENIKKFICGEFVAYVYSHFNKSVFKDKNIEEISPLDIFINDNFEHRLIDKEKIQRGDE